MKKYDPRVYVVIVRTAVSCLATTLAGCGLVDDFGPRATTYNLQTSDSKSSTILLNLLRAAYSTPLQFTDVTTVAGTSTLTGTSSGTIPIPLNKPAEIAARTVGLTPSVSASGTGTVNVANLNNQEFYFGLQTPLSMSQVAYYLQARFDGLDASEMLPLLVSDIELTSTDGSKYVLHNRADSAGPFNAFYYAMQDLIKGGLTVEQTKPKQATDIGPALSEADVRDDKLLPALIAAANPPSSSSTAGGGSGGVSLTAVSKKNDGKTTTTYQLKKGGGDGGGYRFCFAQSSRPYDNPERSFIDNVDFTVTKPPKNKLTISLGKAGGKPIKAVTFEIGPSYYCGAKAGSAQSQASGKQQAGEGITISTRSLEGMFYFLGEMIRTELGLATGQPTSLAIESDFHLFRVDRRLPLSGEPWVSYNGGIFSVAVDPSGQKDASSRILQFLTDLLALQSSAKSLPTPNVIAITTP